jgi:hypothetical protein
VRARYEYSHKDRLAPSLERSSGGSAKRAGLQRGETNDDIIADEVDKGMQDGKEGLM